MTEGQKYDQGKPPMDLLDGYALEQIALVLAHGAEKYGRYNWRGGIAYSRLIAAILRHLTAFNNGQDADPESGISHLAHAGCGIMFLLWMTKFKSELDDRFKI